MKRASLFAAVAIVALANALALIHAWRNRSGPVDTDITLTERELPLSYNPNDEDSGVALRLSWLDRGWVWFVPEQPAPWLDQNRLQELGFETKMPPSDDKANEFYARQRARRAFIALEYEGPAWRQYIEQSDREDVKRAELSNTKVPPSRREWESHLIAIDAASDAVRLRARHPDRGSVMIVPAAVRIAVQPSVAARHGTPSARLTGWIRDVPSSIHVPRPFSDAFRRLPEERRKAIYRVHLRYGASFEPWIIGVEFPTAATP